MLDRLSLIIGNENINKIKNTTVLVLGLGGVGSYAVESLVRSGIEKIILVDKDKVDLTNLNRQLMAYQNNIGMPKTDVFKKRIYNINPNCIVDVIFNEINVSNIDLLFKNNPDYIVDACDTISVKKELIRKCITNNVKLISSMGTGNKMDPSKLRIDDIRKTEYDPIAKIIRKMVKEEKINKKVMVVWSNEKPIITNSKVIGSNSFVPAIAGLLCASYVINDIIKR